MAEQLQTTKSSTPPETSESSPAESNGLPLDVIFSILSNERRRRILRYLAISSERATLGEISEHIARLENDKPEKELSSTERKRVYICLYQCHLPQMDDAGIIDFDDDRKTLKLGENAEAVFDYLPQSEGVGPPRGTRERMADVVTKAAAIRGRLSSFSPTVGKATK